MAEMVFVHPPYETLEAQFMRCPSFRESHGWVTDERRKELIVEFVKKLTADDWRNLPYIVGKISYISDVQADPIKDVKLPWRGWYRYEVRPRLDAKDDVPYLVLELEHTFRNKIFGAGLREIWVAIEVVELVSTQLNPEAHTALKNPATKEAVRQCALTKPSEGLSLDRPTYWLSRQPFEAVEMWEDGDEKGTT